MTKNYKKCKRNNENKTNSSNLFSKLTLSFMAMFMLIGLTGCGKKYQYLQKTKDVTLATEEYKMQVPADSEVNTIYNSTSYVFTHDDHNYIVNVALNKAPVNVAKYIKEDVIRGYYTYDLDTGLRKILSLPDDFSIKDKSKKATFEGIESKKDSGSFKDVHDKKYKYVCYDFYVDEKKLAPCEVFVASTTAKNKDLSNVAEEVIKSIEKAKK